MLDTAYLWMMYFLFRIDRSKKRGDDTALKAISVLSGIELLVISAAYDWLRQVAPLHRASKMQLLVVFVALWGANFSYLRRAGWTELEKRLARYSDRQRRRMLTITGVAYVVALTFCLMTIRVFHA